MLHVLTATAILGGCVGVIKASIAVIQAERASAKIRDRILEHVNHSS